jgi:hypothetical protein
MTTQKWQRPGLNQCPGAHEYRATLILLVCYSFYLSFNTTIKDTVEKVNTESKRAYRIRPYTGYRASGVLYGFWLQEFYRRLMKQSA